MASSCGELFCQNDRLTRRVDEPNRHFIAGGERAVTACKSELRSLACVPLSVDGDAVFADGATDGVVGVIEDIVASNVRAGWPQVSSVGRQVHQAAGLLTGTLGVDDDFEIRNAKRIAGFVRQADDLVVTASDVGDQRPARLGDDWRRLLGRLGSCEKYARRRRRR